MKAYLIFSRSSDKKKIITIGGRDDVLPHINHQDVAFLQHDVYLFYFLFSFFHGMKLFLKNDIIFCLFYNFKSC